MKKLFFLSILAFGFATWLGFGFVVPHAFSSHPSGNSNINFNEPNHWAWNDVVGWIDFCDVIPGGGDCNLPVLVNNTTVTGYASSSVGFIELDCATSPAGNICGAGTGNWFVSNDTQGGLAGYAWNDAIGWISFCGNEFGASIYVGATWTCPDSDTGGIFPYQVTINPSTGDFTGYAWNDVVGWISFNCANPGANGCLAPGGVDYKVNTEWRPIPPALPIANLTSSAFDTCANPQTECGTAPNSIVWQGNVPSPGNPSNYVQFHIASSNALGGPWNFVGPDGTAATFYSTQNFTILGSVIVSASIPINQANHLNQRYFKYRIFLNPCNPINGCTPPESPIINDVVLNWSP